jgi:hypothetical protein
VLPPGERSNAWTVALTPGGVVDYLNRKTSPLGAHSQSFVAATPGPLGCIASAFCATDLRAAAVHANAARAD